MRELATRIYSSNDFGRAASKDDQCDCACPTGEYVVQVDERTLQDAFHRSDVYQFNLDTSYKLLFNQSIGREVVVVNEDAYAFWENFKIPTLLDTLDASGYETARRMIDLALLEPVLEHYHPYKPPPDSLSVWLHITNSCNLLCTYCYVNKSNDHMDLETGKAAIDAAFRSALKGGFKKVNLKFAGGEPTLRLDTVFQLYAYGQEVSKREGIEIESVILSNGTTLRQEDTDEIRARGMRLMLSIDGIGIMHDAQRPFLGGQGTYEKVWRALERAINSGLKPFISITVTDESVSGLPELITRLLPLDLPFNLNFARPVMPGRVPDNQKMIAGLKETFQCIEANLPGYSLLGSVLDRSLFSSAHERPCGVGEAYMVVDQHGDVASCQMTLKQSVTNIHVDDPFLMLKVHEGFKNPSVDQKEGCSQCQWKYVCAGGCPQAAYQTTGRYDVASPFCEVYKAMYPELLRLEGLRILKYSGNME